MERTNGIKYTFQTIVFVDGEVELLIEDADDDDDDLKIPHLHSAVLRI